MLVSDPGATKQKSPRRGVVTIGQHMLSRQFMPIVYFEAEWF